MSRFDAQYKAEFEEFKEKASCGKVEIFSMYQLIYLIPMKT